MAAEPDNMIGGLLKATSMHIPNTAPGITYGNIMSRSRKLLILLFRFTIRYDSSMPATIIIAMAIIEKVKVFVMFFDNL